MHVCAHTFIYTVVVPPLVELVRTLNLREVNKKALKGNLVDTYVYSCILSSTTTFLRFIIQKWNTKIYIASYKALGDSWMSGRNQECSGHFTTAVPG